MKWKFKLFVSVLLLWLVALIYFGGKLVVRANTSKRDATVTKHLKASIEAFQTEHRYLPGGDANRSFDVDLETDQSFMALLTVGSPGKTAPLSSPRGISFFSAKAAVQDPETGFWHSGLKMDPDGQGGLFDSVGNYFRLRLDSNGDGTVHSPTDNEPLPTTVLIWSAGRDGEFETWRDNLKSW